MRSYYHCSVSKYGKRRSVFIILIGSVCAEAAVIAFIVMFFGMFGSEGAEDEALIGTMQAAAAIFVLTGLALCLAAAHIADKKTSRHSRYTFLDIQLKFAVISTYSGEMRILGRNAVFRELYVIPFKDFASAVPTRDGRHFTIDGKLRRYGMESDFLGYHIRNGDIEFDRMWLNAGAFEELPGVTLPAYFGDPAKICAALTEAKKRFDDIPKPQKHEFREADFIRRRPRRRLLPEDLDFSRTWK